MSRKQISQRSVLRTSGVALTALSGASFVGSADVPCTGCDDDGGGGSGGGGSGSPPSVSTMSGYASSCTDIVVHGYLNSLGSDDGANVWFDFGRQGEGLPHYTNLKYVNSAGSFCDGNGCWYDSFDTFGCIEPGTYEYRAVATNDWGRSEGSVRTFTV